MSLDSRAANRAGLARFRPLAARSGSNKNSSISPDSKSNNASNHEPNNNNSNNNNITDLPDGWYFNETREQDFWEDIERGQASQTEESEAKKKMLKESEHITDLQDTSSKLRSLVDQFDEIDQDTLMILLQMYDDGYGICEDLDQQMIMSDSKTHVLDFMTQLKGLSDSQTSLMENLRFFFSTLQQHSSNGESDNVSKDAIPNADDAYEHLSSMLREYAEKSERAACLHNDINDFWFKQIANYKRVVLMRDEEIRKLQKTIGDTQAAAQARRARKKNELDKSGDAAKNEGTPKEQLDNQIRLNQELKQQIEQLKAALKEGDLQKATLQSNLSSSSFEFLNKDSLLKDNEINTLKIEFETKISSQKFTIEQLMKQIEQLKKIICDQDIKYDQLNEKFHEIEKQRDELNASLQKQTKLLELEQQRNSSKPQPIPDNLIDRQELYEAEMMHQNEIRELKERQRDELMRVADEEREKFILERQKIIDSIESGDTKSIIESISNECEKKIQKQKEEYEIKEKGILQVWAGKVALLTRQYENRLKAMAASHEVDLLMAKDSVKYEVKKAELDLEERYNLQLLEMGRAREEKYDQFKHHLDNLQNELDITREENITLKSQLGKILKANGKANEKADGKTNEKADEKSSEKADEKTNDSTDSQTTEPKPKETENNSENQKNDSKNNTFTLSEREKLIEKYAMKMKIMKQEMDDQMNWSLEKQKNYYEREMSKAMIQHQKEMRERLMELQEVVTQAHQEKETIGKEEKTEKEEDNNEPKGEKKMLSIMREISQAFFDMNSQFEKIDENEEEPTMSVKEATERTKMLTDRLIQLSSENQDLRSSQVFKESSDEIIQQLKDKISYLESLQNGDSKAALEKMKQMEEHYKHELEIKDQMLLNFQTINQMFSKADQEESRRRLQIQIICNDVTSIFENLVREKSQGYYFADYEGENTVSSLDFNQFLNQTYTESLAKPPPAETNSAPIEYTTLRKPPVAIASNTGRKKKPMRMHAHQEIQVGSSNQMDLSISEINQLFEADGIDISPLQFKPTAFLIDEELHNIILDDVTPIHSEDERNLVKNVIDEVFERLPISKTNRDSSSQLSLEKYSPSPKTAKSASDNEPNFDSSKSLPSISTSILSQSISPRQKKINSKEKHFSFVVIQSFYIPKAIRKERSPIKPKNAPDSNSNSEKNTTEESYVEYVCLSPCDNSITSFEIKENKVFLTNSYLLIEPDYNNLFDEGGQFIYQNVQNEEAIKNFETIISEQIKSMQNYEAPPSSPTSSNQGESSETQNQIIFTSYRPKQQSFANSSSYNTNNNNRKTFVPTITNEVLIDIPYILYTKEELTEEVKSHILDLEKEISELKGRPLPTQIVNTYVPREVNPDQRQITLQLYMPLTGEESKKLREERKKRLSKDSSLTVKNTNENVNLNLPEQAKLTFADLPLIHDQDQTKLDENFTRSKSLNVIHNNQEEPEKIVHAESQIALTHDLSCLSFESDPFTAAKQIITSHIKYTQKFTNTETELLKKLGRNMDAYDAYVSASGIADESHYSFLNNLKQSKKDLDAIHGQSFQMNLANDSLLKRINQMSVAYDKVLRKLDELENDVEDQDIALQQEILDSISTNDEDGKPTSVSNLEKLQKLESSLDLLENLGLIKDPELLQQKQTLLEEIKLTQNKITSNEEVSQETIDKLIVKTQDFIGGIKPIKSVPQSPNGEKDDGHSKEQMKKDLSRIRRQRDSLKRNLNNEKQKTEELKQQIVALNNKIETERESHESDLLAYRAQVETLKKSISNEGQSAIDLLKQQLISMQALAETSRNERDLFKAKLDDCEEALLMKEETIDQLNQQIETLLQNDFEKSQELDQKEKSKKKSGHDDYDMSKEVKKINDELQMQQSKQMETLMAENKKLTDECNNLNQRVIHLKQKLRSVKDANSDMNLKLALGVPPKERRTSDKATQYPPASFINLSDSKSSVNMNKNNESATRSREFIKPSESQELRMKKEKEEREKELLNKQKEEQEEMKNKENENDANNNQDNDNNVENNEQNQNDQNDENQEDEEQKDSYEDRNEIEGQDSNLSYGEGFDTFDSYEELDTVGDVLLKMPDDKSDDVKYKFGDLAPRVHDPISIPKKKKKNQIMILNTKPKTQRNNKRIQPTVIHHLPGGPSLENKMKEREEDLKALTINNQPQGKRYLTGTTQPVRPTSSVLKSSGTRNNLPMFDHEGKQIEVGNENQIPIIESAFTLPSYSEDSSGIYNNHSASLGSYNNNHSTSLGSYNNNHITATKNNEDDKKSSYIIDKSLQSNPVAPLRITLVVHDKDKEKEQRKSYSVSNSIINNNNGGPIIIPVQNEKNLKRMVTPLENYSKGPPVVGRPIEKGPAITEAQKIINKLRESKRKLQASNDQKDIEILNLKQKLSELTLAIHRLKLDNIKKADDFKRLSIRYDYVQNRLEMRSAEVANRDAEIQKLKRELVIVRMQVQPVNQQLAKLKNAQRERDRLQREQERRRAVALATKNALGSKTTNDPTKKHLQTILENQQLSIARIEAQRRMWLDIERNHMMGVLSAMSLLSTSQYKIVKGVLPSYSPFSSSKVTTLKQVLEMKNKDSSYSSNRKYNNSNFGNKNQIETSHLLSTLNPDFNKSNSKQTTVTYADKLNALDRIEPPLSKEEKELIVKQKETPEIEQKIVSLLQNERNENTISKAKIDTNTFGSNS